MNTRSNGDLYAVEEEGPFEVMDPAHPYDPVQLSRSLSGGWSATATMETGQTGASTGPQASFERAETYTVRFGMIPPSSGGSADADPYGNTVHCVAIIRTSVEGNWIERRVSICQGAAITLAGQAVQVKFLDLSVVTDPEVPDGLQYQVTAQIVLGERAGYGTPPSLFAFTDLVAGAALVEAGQITLTEPQSARYPIPQNAGVISVEVTSTGDGETLVEACGGDLVLKSWDPQINVGFVILPPSCTYLIVSSSGGEDTVVNVTVTWGTEG